MKYLVQKLFFFLVVLLVGCSDKGEFVIHKCQPSNPNCLDESASVVRVKVDKSSNKVLMTYYKNELPTESDIFGKDNCEIFDEKNWVCRSSDSGLTISRWEFAMREGSLTYSTERNALQLQLLGANPIYRVESSSFFNR
jgi:hypothetical protein